LLVIENDFLKSMETQKVPVAVYAESTPNPATMKFVANKLLIEDGATVEYTSPQAAKASLLASQLFNFPFVAGVFIAGNFVTITKNNMAEWMDVTLDLREFIKDFLSSGKEVLSAPLVIGGDHAGQATIVSPVDPVLNDSHPKTEIEHRIVELLEEYIRPAVEQDGGAIHFKSFENGTLKVVLRGACSGCPSSTVTLKAGIQGLFQRMLPEVKEVVAEEA
jgi:NFU1 iron-sulfur cluster scaffold homolog, mitochondrial